MWLDLNQAWQASFEQAWIAFCKGSVPIGAVVVDEKGEILSRGRSMQYELQGDPGEVSDHKLSHAELNALLKVRAREHPRIREYTLYTTAEPCPLCFGALVMSNLRHLRFAARDGWAGSSQLSNPYIASKGIQIEGPFMELEKVQITMASCFELMGGRPPGPLHQVWGEYASESVEVGIQLYQDREIQDLIESPISHVYDYILSKHD